MPGNDGSAFVTLSFENINTTLLNTQIYTDALCFCYLLFLRIF